MIPMKFLVTLTRLVMGLQISHCLKETVRGHRVITTPSTVGGRLCTTHSRQGQAWATLSHADRT